MLHESIASYCMLGSRSFVRQNDDSREWLIDGAVAFSGVQKQARVRSTSRRLHLPNYDDATARYSDCRFYRAGHTGSIMLRKYFRRRLSRVRASDGRNIRAENSRNTETEFAGIQSGSSKTLNRPRSSRLRRNDESVIVALLHRRHAFIDDANDAVVPQKRFDTLS